MARKRKSEATPLDEVDRTMYSTFCSAANSLSQLYTQAMNQQKLSFQAGERHALEKLYQWILRQHDEGSRVTAADIVSHIQNEIDYGEDTAMSSRLQTATHLTTSGTQISSGPHGQAAVGAAPRTTHSDQMRNSVFSNALSSPVRWSLQPYQLDQGEGCYPSSVNGARSHGANSSGHNRVNSPSSNDSSMDMHSDNPANEPY